MMHKLKRAVLFIILASTMALQVIGCDEDEKTDRLDKKIKYRSISEPAGEMFAYTQQEMMDTNGSGTKSIRSKFKQSYFVGSIETGEIFSEYRSGVDQLFTINISEDGTRLFKQVQPESKDRLDLVMTNIKDDSMIWQRTIKAGRLQPDPSVTIGWDDDAGWLVLFVRKRDSIEIEESMREIESRDFTYRKSEERSKRPVYCVFYVLDPADGEIIREEECVFLHYEIISPMQNLRNGGGKLFFLARDDPFVEDRDTSNEQFDLFVVDPIEWEYEQVILPFDMSEPVLQFHPDIDGENLFIRTSRKIEKNPLSFLGNDIVRFNLETGKVTTLMQMTDAESYRLSGITPDGKTLSVVKITQGEKKFPHIPIVLDVETGKVREIDSALRDNFVVFTKISPSGRYLVEDGYRTNIWVHDLETGEERLLVTEPTGSEVSFQPGFSGGYNSII